MSLCRVGPPPRFSTRCGRKRGKTVGPEKWSLHTGGDRRDLVDTRISAGPWGGSQKTPKCKGAGKDTKSLLRSLVYGYVHGWKGGMACTSSENTGLVLSKVRGNLSIPATASTPGYDLGNRRSLRRKGAATRELQKRGRKLTFQIKVREGSLFRGGDRCREPGKKEGCLQGKNTQLSCGQIKRTALCCGKRNGSSLSGGEKISRIPSEEGRSRKGGPKPGF